MAQSSKEETFRLAMMEAPGATIVQLRKLIEQETNESLTVQEFGRFCIKYRGVYGSVATHDYMTGEPF